MNSDPSTVLEKDFTVEGRKGQLQCPFSAPNEHEQDIQGHDDGAQDHTPHPVSDPICAAMLEDSKSAATTNGAVQCPIRFMDKHSPEEIARYVETHKHELPRSHEVCLRRNQKNEEQIRKLDAKYGNLVSMIEDLSHLHAPMLPDAEVNQEGHPTDRQSDRRVSDWAQNVSANVNDAIAAQEDAGHDETTLGDPDLDRQSRFDRPLKEVRVGESPSRPWGISVPFPPDEPLARPASPPAPVRIPSLTPAHQQQQQQHHLEEPAEASAAEPAVKPSLKCPFDHTKMRPNGQTSAPAVPPHAPKPEASSAPRPPNKCPFDFSKMRLDGPGLAEFPKMETPDQSPPTKPTATSQAAEQPHPTHLKQPQPAPLDSPPASYQPAFLNLPPTATTKTGGTAGMTVPQMVFNGPVFIGYPMEQAIQFMQQLQNQQQPR